MAPINPVPRFNWRRRRAGTVYQGLLSARLSSKRHTGSLICSSLAARIAPLLIESGVMRTSEILLEMKKAAFGAVAGLAPWSRGCAICSRGGECLGSAQGVMRSGSMAEHLSLWDWAPPGEKPTAAGTSQPPFTSPRFLCEDVCPVTRVIPPRLMPWRPWQASPGLSTGTIARRVSRGFRALHYLWKHSHPVRLPACSTTSRFSWRDMHWFETCSRWRWQRSRRHLETETGAESEPSVRRGAQGVEGSDTIA